MIGQSISHYKILEKLGEGGMGVVYKAEDTKLKRIVAIKFLPKGLEAHEPERARFLQEAQAASALNHPNVCTIYDIKEEGDQHFIVMEYVDGVTLREKIEECCRAKCHFALPDAISYAIQIGEALQEAHTHGIVHRDVKPENIMVNTKNQIKVMDFGLAKLKGSMKLTRTSSTVGTLAYMAPEQIQGGEVDARSDIFSFGIVLYEMLTGRLPFRGEHEAAMMYSILNEQPQPIQRYLPEVSSEMLHILNRALEKDRDERYQSVNDMVIDLRRLGKETASPQTSLKTKGGRTSEDHATVGNLFAKFPSRNSMWFIACIVAVACACIYYFFVRSPAVREINPKMSFHMLQVPFQEISFPGLSSDGKWVVFPAKNGRYFGVFFMNTSGGEPRCVTQDSLLLPMTTDLSPDGSQIVFDNINMATQHFELRLVPSLGGLSKVIADAGYLPKWRPDGHRIGYIVGGVQLPSKSGKLELWSMKSDGNDNRLEYTDTISAVTGECSFAWSPDGKSIAWLRTFPEGYQEIIVHVLTNGTDRQITFGRSSIQDVCWTESNGIIFSSGRSGNVNLWLVPSSGGDALQMSRGNGPDRGMKISADEQRLVYVQQRIVGHLWMSEDNFSSTHQLTFDSRLLDNPALSPRGDRIAFTVTDYDVSTFTGSHIYTMNKDGSNRMQLTYGDELASNLAWSPDGKWISYSNNIPSPDSPKVYLLEANNPGVPRFIGNWKSVWWIDSERLVAFTNCKTWRISTKQSAPEQFFLDSTWAYPILKEKYMLYYDFHRGHEGWWSVRQLSGTNSSTNKSHKICSTNYEIILAPSGAFLFCIQNDTKPSLLQLPDGKEMPFPKFTGTMHVRSGIGVSSSSSLSPDGKTVVYQETMTIGNLVMIEKPLR